MLQEPGRKIAIHRAWRHILAPLMFPVTALIAGCVGERVPYPDHFPPLAATEPGECPDISGQYSTMAGWSRISTILWFDEEDKSRLEADPFKAHRFVVTQPDPRTIEFVAPLESGRSLHRSLRRDDNGYSCDNGMVVISSATERISDSKVPSLGWDWKEVHFARTIEGSLAVEYVSKGGGLLLLVVLPIPVVGVDGFWHLILEVPEAAEKQTSPIP